MTAQQKDALGFIAAHPGATQADLRKAFGWGTSKTFSLVEFLLFWGYVGVRSGHEVAGAHKNSRCFYARLA